MGSPTLVKKLCEPYATGGNVIETNRIFAGPASYTTGGDSLSATDLGFGPTGRIISAQVQSEDGTQIAQVVFPSSDKVTSVKLLITDLAGTQVANASDQSAKKFRIRAIGVQ